MLVARLAPDFRARDHRLLGWGTTISDAATFVRAQQALIELAPDARYRIDHVRVRGRVCLLESVQEGTREGGRFENPMLAVLEYDEDGRTVSMEVYDTAQLEQARARFEELSASNDGGAAAGGSR